MNCTYEGMILINNSFFTKNGVLYQMLCRDVTEIVSFFRIFYFWALKIYKVLNFWTEAGMFESAFSFIRCSFSVMHIRLEV